MTDSATLLLAQQVITHWFGRCQVSAFGDGHINDTFLVQHADERFVLQRVNEFVFRRGQELMTQQVRVLDHWRARTGYRVPELASTRSGKPWLHNDQGLWRLWRYIGDSRVADTVTPDLAESAGRAFGEFQVAMRGFAPDINNPIDHFLELEHYLQAFDSVADGASVTHRNLVDQHRPLAAQLRSADVMIHGDCKLDNVLFATTNDQVAAVIDFDTVMRGHWAWDFGDLVRSLSLDLGRFDIECFAAALKGFRDAGVTAASADAVAAPAYVTLMLAIRFLTDHLLGDQYFRVVKPGDNLQRAQAQFDLLELIVAEEQSLHAVAAQVLDQ